MNVQVQLIRLHEPEAVREIIAEAGRIADDAGVEDDARWVAVFEQAASLLGQRHALVMQPQQLAVPLDHLGPNGQRRR